MSKINVEMTLNTKLLLNMVMLGASESEMERAINYTKDLIVADKAYSKNDIQHLRKKYCDKDMELKYDIPNSIKRRAQVKVSDMLKELGA